MANPPLLTVNNLPILQKISQAYKTWHNTLPHIPRLTRYSLGERIDKYFLELTELTLTAGYAKKDQKLLLVQKASIKLDTLKFLLQMAWELKAIENKRFADLAAQLVETGKMLGGWQKQLTKETPSQWGEG